MSHLFEFRSNLNLTQRQMAEKMNISKSYYEKVEKGFKKPGRGFLEKFKSTFPEIDINIFFNNDIT